MREQKYQSKIQKALAEVNQKFGQEAIMLLGSKAHQKIATFSSGSLVINEILGINGYPRGRIIEIYGPESSGKTTIALHAIAEVQKEQGIAAFIDAEHAIDPTYASKLGVKIEDLILAQPDSGEQALEIVDTLAKTQAVSLIVVDSVAALTPEVELNGEMRDVTMGAQARLMAKALRKITGTLAKNNTTIIFINQIREKVGVTFGNPEVTPGGRALKFFASIRLEVRRVASIGKADQLAGNNIKIKVVKNKLAAPFKVGHTTITFGEGILPVLEVIELAEKRKIIQRKGAWYAYQGTNLAQGKTKLQLFLTKETKIYQAIYDQLIKALATSD